MRKLRSGRRCLAERYKMDEHDSINPTEMMAVAAQVKKVF